MPTSREKEAKLGEREMWAREKVRGTDFCFIYSRNRKLPDRNSVKIR